MKRKVAILLASVIGLYFLSYLWLRASRIEIWERNGKPYVIFPKGNIAVYYFYRPITYVDGALTGMGFHIGPHEG